MSNATVVRDLTTVRTVMRTFVNVDLRPYFNNDGMSFDAAKNDGDFDGNGGTFPAEELPPSNALIHLDGVPFYFPSKEDGARNNMALSGQSIAFPPVRIKAVHVLGAVEGQAGEVYEEEVTLSLEDGTLHPFYIGMSNWLLPPRYNERVAFQCSHLHFPDPGQEPNPGRITPEIDRYGPASIEFASCDVDRARDEANAANGIWQPRIYWQRVPLAFRTRATSLTFLENLNFHVFALTLETEEA